MSRLGGLFALFSELFGSASPLREHFFFWSLGTHTFFLQAGAPFASSSLPLVLCSPSCVPLFLFLSPLFREFHLTSSSSERELCLTFSSSLRLRLFFQIHCVLPVLVDSGGPFLWTIGRRLDICTPCFLPSGFLVFGFALGRVVCPSLFWGFDFFCFFFLVVHGLP